MTFGARKAVVCVKRAVVRQRLDDDVLVAAAAGIVVSEQRRQKMASHFRRRRPDLRRDFRETRATSVCADHCETVFLDRRANALALPLRRMLEL